MSESSVDDVSHHVGSPPRGQSTTWAVHHVGSLPDSPLHHKATLKEGELLAWEFIPSELPSSSSTHTESELPSSSTHSETWAWLSVNEREKENFNRTRAEQLWPAGSSSNSCKSLSTISEDDQEDMRSYLPRDPRPKSIRPPEDSGHAKIFTVEENILINNWEHVTFNRFQHSYRNNTVLDFFSKHTFKEVDCMMKHSMRFRNHNMCDAGSRNLDVAVVSVWVVRHRVLIIEASDNYDRQRNAWESFPNDVMGKWCQPSGDLVVLPGVHQDIKILEDVLYEMMMAMRCIRKLKGPVSRFYTTEMSSFDVDRCKPIIDAKYTSPLPPFTLHFRPIFTNFNFNMNEAAARLSVEMWQTGFLVFLKLADWALSTNDLGAALVFVQKMQRSVLWFTTLMPRKVELTEFYMFTMCHWVTGRCYFSILQNYDKIEEYKEDYGVIQNKLEEFSRVFFDSIANPTTLLFAYEVPMEFPSSAHSCIKMADWGYSQIAVPEGWMRSAYEQETSRCLRCLHDLDRWTDRIQDNREPKRALSERKQFLMVIEGDLFEMLNVKSGSNKVLVYCLLAKCYRLYIAIKASQEMNHVLLKPHKLKLYRIAHEQIKFRSYVQCKALSAINDDYAALRSSETLSILLQMIVRTTFDEVVYCIEDQELDPNSSKNVERLFRRLPVLVDMWFRPRRQNDSTAEWILQVNSKTFNVTMTMFFFGLASCYNVMRLHGSHDKETLDDNVTYCYALFAAHLRRKGCKLAITKAILDYVLLMERCCLCFESSAPALSHAAERGLLLLRRLVWLLPVFHEHSIVNGGENSPQEYHGVLLDLDYLRSPTFLVQIFGTTAGREKAKFINVADHIEREFKVDLTNPLIDGKHRGKKPAVIKVPKFYPLSYNKFVTANVPTYKPRYTPDKRPPLQGRDYCVHKNCPIEQYHEAEENNFNPPTGYDEETYSKVFKDIKDFGASELMTFPDLMKQILKLLKRLIEISKIGLQRIMNDTKLNDDIESEVEKLNPGKDTQNNEHHTPRYLTSELKLLDANLKSEDSPQQIVMKVLFKLDRVLNQGGISKLLRGEVEIY